MSGGDRLLVIKYPRPPIINDWICTTTLSHWLRSIARELGKSIPFLFFICLTHPRLLPLPRAGWQRVYYVLRAAVSTTVLISKTLWTCWITMTSNFSLTSAFADKSSVEKISWVTSWVPKKIPYRWALKSPAPFLGLKSYWKSFYTNYFL